jgi:hypothetical protein
MSKERIVVVDGMSVYFLCPGEMNPSTPNATTRPNALSASGSTFLPRQHRPLAPHVIHVSAERSESTRGAPRANHGRALLTDHAERRRKAMQEARRNV